MIQEGKEMEQTPEQLEWKESEEIILPPKEKYKLVTILIFAVICLVMAIAIYIKDYGYQDFLPGSDYMDNEQIVASVNVNVTNFTEEV